ncbi:MAG: excinuclease ABC subunit UvrA [Pirellulales bacterium]
MAGGQIELRGVEVHNLKGVDLDIPHRQLTVICGVSGSGKTSLALDTLYAEGQRRYIESFSTYTRQFLDPLAKPDAERIDGLPPAIAVTRADAAQSSRATVASATEIADYLRLVFGRVGQIRCLACGCPVEAQTPQRIAARITSFPSGARLLLGFPLLVTEGETWATACSRLLEEGFVRAVVGGRLQSLAEMANGTAASSSEPNGDGLRMVMVDRLVTGALTDARLLDSIETCLRHGEGACEVLLEQHGTTSNAEGDSGIAAASAAASAAPEAASGERTALRTVSIDGARWQRWRFQTRLACAECGREYLPLEPKLFNYNSPLGACSTCEGFGNLIAIDYARVVPDEGKTLREGALACWNTPAYAHELQALLSLADDLDLPVDVPYRELTAAQRQLVIDGVPDRGFAGLSGFFQWLEKHKYKMQHRVFLSRWRSSRPCPACAGKRLRPEALAVEVGGRDFTSWTALTVTDLHACLSQLTWTDEQRAIAQGSLRQIAARLEFLAAVGLGYLTLDRPLRTLSGGEAQRVALTAALGTSLVNMLYVLDEPSVGLHPADVDRLVTAILRLRDRGNTIVAVEHEEALLRAADRLVEIGPGAGENGGEVVFTGTWEEMLQSPDSLTGDYLAGRRVLSTPATRRASGHGWVRLTNARGRNLRNLTVEFPLGVLCVVTGVSGSGKSSLVQDTLYGALCLRKRKELDEPPLPYDDVFGDGQIDDVVLVDQSPIGRSPRSNPVTYIKAFDPIRQVFAETVEARTRHFGAGHFSFNVEGGRCESCQGDGYLEIDMQFLPDVFLKCPQCNGLRYRREILEVTYRGRNIAEVLGMTAREAFGFFRGQPKVQTRIKQLLDVGLDYLRLGQPANTLSAGEAQRLKLAAHLSSSTRKRTLFLIDEPTTGLHFADIVQLLDCFDALLAVGHSLVVVEHNVPIMKAADYIIDLGPGAADNGGRIVAQGTPERVARCRESATGRILSQALDIAPSSPANNARK